MLNDRTCSRGSAVQEARLTRRKLLPTLLGLLLFILLISACGGSRQATDGGSTSAQPVDEASVPALSGPFGAVATSAISVDLAWDPIDGATGYRIENQFGDSGWLLLTELAADVTTYEDFLAPSNMNLKYRLTPLIGNEEGKALEVTVTTPEEIPNPVTVIATLEEPDYSSIGIDLPGFDASTFDPSTFDPSMLDLSGVDTENLDLTSLSPEPVSDTQRIGPEGGTLSITGRNGVTYTLKIPPDALDFTTIFIMTPVADIEGYPFSEGYFGAVQIQPEGVFFDAPAVLTFEFPEEGPAPNPPSAEVVPIAFAYKFGGQEFHLTPIVEEDTPLSRNQATRSEKLASPTHQVLSNLMVMVTRAQTVGAGMANEGEIHSQTTDHSVPNPNENAAQKAAASQADDTQSQLRGGPLTDEEREKIERERDVARRRKALQIVDSMKAASDMNEFLDFGLADFRVFYSTPGYALLPVDFKNYLWDTAISVAKKFLEPKECPSPQAAAIQELVRRLMKPKNAFDQEFADRFKKEYGRDGENLLKSLNATQSCKVRLTISSTVSIESTNPPSTVHMVVYAEFPLQWRYEGEPFLYGAGDITYQEFQNSGTCQFNQDTLKGSVITVVRLKPVYQPNGDLEDWLLWPYEVAGPQKSATGECKEGTDITKGGAENIGGTSGDLWGGSISMATPGFESKLGWLDWDLHPSTGELAMWHKEDANGQGSVRVTHYTELRLLKSIGK